MAETDPEFPTYGELQLLRLPKWACVALAARCALRVEPLFNPVGLPKKKRRAAAMAVRRAVRVAAGDAVKNSADTNARGAARAARTARVAGATRVAEYLAEADAAAVYSASRAAAAAEAAIAAVDGADVAAETAEAAGSAARAAAAERVRGEDARAAIIAAVRKDLNDIRALSEAQPELFGAQIDATDTGPLGPLWPDGPPTWYVEAKARYDREVAGDLAEAEQANREKATATDPAQNLSAPPLTLYFSLDEFTDEEITEQLIAFSDLYHAISGDELVITGMEQFDLCAAPAPMEV